MLRGHSPIDGRPVIALDWRGMAAQPASNAIPHVVGYLIYDECRAIQTGVWGCAIYVDFTVGETRGLWRFGWMPWVGKGPPSIEEFIQATTVD